MLKLKKKNQAVFKVILMLWMFYLVCFRDLKSVFI